MSTLAKVFVVINLLLAVIFTGVTLTLYAKRVKFKEFYEVEKESHESTRNNLGDKINALETEKTHLITERDNLTRDNKELQSRLDTVKNSYKEAMDQYLKADAERQTLLAKNEEKDNELQRRHQQIDNMHKIVLKQQQALKVAKTNERIAIDQKIEMENELNGTRQQLADVRKEKSKVEKDLYHHNWIIERLMDHGVRVNDIVFGGGELPVPPIDGQVLAVRRDVNLVMLSVGTDDGVKKGFKFTIYRGDRYIGKIEIEKVFKDMCSGRILPRLTKEEIAEGDSAATRVYQ